MLRLSAMWDIACRSRLQGDSGQLEITYLDRRELGRRAYGDASMGEVIDALVEYTDPLAVRIAVHPGLRHGDAQEWVLPQHSVLAHELAHVIVTERVIDARFEGLCGADVVVEGMVDVVAYELLRAAGLEIEADLLHLEMLTCGRLFGAMTADEVEAFVSSWWPVRRTVGPAGHDRELGWTPAFMRELAHRGIAVELGLVDPARPECRAAVGPERVLILLEEMARSGEDILLRLRRTASERVAGEDAAGPVVRGAIGSRTGGRLRVADTLDGGVLDRRGLCMLLGPFQTLVRARGRIELDFAPGSAGHLVLRRVEGDASVRRSILGQPPSRSFEVVYRSPFENVVSRTDLPRDERAWLDLSPLPSSGRIELWIDERTGRVTRITASGGGEVVVPDEFEVIGFGIDGPGYVDVS